MAAAKLGYRPGLDGLRALAVCSVILFHYYAWPVGGNAGVELFFVLSGFLITTLLMEEWQKGGRIRLGRFYLRRALRLFPALWVFLTVSAVVSYSAHEFVARRSFFYGFTYTTNIAWATGLNVGFLPHLWSLAVEEQFYLVWPLLLIVMLGRRWRLSRILAAAALLALVVVVLRDTRIDYHLGYGALAYFKFDAILIGCIAGLLFTSRHRDTFVRFCCILPITSVAFVWLLYSLIAFPFPVLRTGNVVWFPFWTLFNLSAAITIIWVVEGCPRVAPARWLLEAPPVRYIGRISYALYLWHPFVRDWLRWPHGGNIQSGKALGLLGLAGTFAIASGSYYLVERPFLRMKWRLSSTGSHDVDAAIILKHGSVTELSGVNPADQSST